MKRGALFLAALMSITGAAVAQGTASIYAPGFAASDSSLLFLNTPLALYNGLCFPASTAMSSMGMVSLDFGPLAPITPRRRHVSNIESGDSSLDSVARLDSPNRVYTSGEIGISYGHSVGKGSADEFRSYIIGTVGNDQFQVSAGAEYQESSVHFPRHR